MKTVVPDQIPHSFAAEMAVRTVALRPPKNIFARHWGAAPGDQADGEHGCLEANLWIFRKNSRAAFSAMVCLDFCIAREPADLDEFRGVWAEALGTTPDRVWVCLSHTHASVSICRGDAAHPGGDLIEGYRKRIAKEVAKVLRDSAKHTFRGEVAWETGHCTLARNRDLWSEESKQYVCGFNPSGEADTTLLVGRVSDQEGNIRGVMLNYACHPTTLAWQNNLASPDWIGAMRDTLRDRFADVPVCFLQGASGELAPRRQYTGDTAIADANGRCLGYATLSVIEGMLPPWSRLKWAGIVESGAPLGTWKAVRHTGEKILREGQFTIPLKLKKFPPIAELKDRLLKSQDRVEQERLRRFIARASLPNKNGFVQLPVWWRLLGSTLWIAVGSELYSHFQTCLRAAFPDKTVIIATLSNTATLSYLYPETFAGKTLYQAWTSPLASDALARAERACLKHLRKEVKQVAAN